MPALQAGHLTQRGHTPQARQVEPESNCVDIWLCTGYMIELASHHLSDKAPSTLATAGCQGRDLVQNRLLVLAS